MTDQITIRMGSIEDLVAVQACIAEAYAPYVSVIGKEPAAMRTDFSSYLTQGNLQIATLDGELVGLMVTISEQDYLEVRSVAVMPSFQRRGLGRRLMAWAEKRARSLGHKTVRLYTNAKLQDLITMYEGMGFVTREKKYDGGYDRVFMSKEL